MGQQLKIRLKRMRRRRWETRKKVAARKGSPASAATASDAAKV